MIWENKSYNIVLYIYIYIQAHDQVIGASVCGDGGNHDGQGVQGRGRGPGRGRDRGIGDYQGDDQVKCDLCSFCSNCFLRVFFFKII